MRHLESFNHWYDKILNNAFFCIDDSKVKTIAIAWGFKENSKWVFLPRLVIDNWQYTNAIFSIRIGLPFAIFIQIRWTDKIYLYPNWLPYFRGMQEKQFIQFGIGWKQTGRFAIHFRPQTDTSAAIGYHAGMPNTGQASGFNFGRH